MNDSASADDLCVGCGLLAGTHLVHPGTLAVHASCHASWGIDYEHCVECQSEHFGAWAYCDRCFTVAQSIALALGAVLSLQQSDEDVLIERAT